MKRLLLFFCMLLFLTCNEKPKIEYTIVSGKIQSPIDNTVKISGDDLEFEIPIKPDGTFRDTLELDESGFYTLNHGREMSSIYLTNGQNLELNLDAKAFDETLKYSGTGSVENNYLANKMLNREEFRLEVSDIYRLEENEFLKFVDSLNYTQLHDLETVESKVDASFLASEKRNLRYDKYSMLNSYGQFHAYYAKKPDFEVSETFLPEELKNMTFDNASHYRTSDSYREMAFNQVMDKIFNHIGDDYQNASPEDLEPITDIEIDALKNRIVGYLGNFLVSPANPNMKALYAFFIENTDDKDIKNELTAKYDSVKNLTKGNPSPQFVKYENHDGGVLSLSDLRGKYVYVDVWATWCGPCIREIPSLKKIEEEFKGRNIHFVSTSIDVANKHEVWANMVKEKDLGGIQLMADKAWESNFVREYAIDGIPRFILIDPEGNIVSADAPRPSNPKLLEMFKKLDI